MKFKIIAIILGVVTLGIIMVVLANRHEVSAIDWTDYPSICLNSPDTNVPAKFGADNLNRISRYCVCVYKGASELGQTELDRQIEYIKQTGTQTNQFKSIVTNCTENKD